MHRSLWILPVALLAGCAHKPDAKTEPLPAAVAKADPQPQKAEVTDASALRSCVQDSDCKESEVCGQQRQCVPISAAGLNDCTMIRVHFAFNSSDIDQGDRGGLERSARCLQSHQHLHVTIEGNADERGTEEYNLALGDRRATSVAKYLRTLGASDVQLKTISFGEEKPTCNEHDEACWAQNRRAAVRSPMATIEN